MSSTVKRRKILREPPSSIESLNPSDIHEESINNESTSSMDTSETPRDSLQLLKIWFLIFMAGSIAIYFVYELLALIIRFSITVTFKILIPILGLYIVLDLCRIGRILPHFDPRQFNHIHQTLLRSISRSESLHNLITSTFKYYYQPPVSPN